MYFECYYQFSLISTASEHSVKYAELMMQFAVASEIDYSRVINFKSI